MLGVVLGLYPSGWDLQVGVGRVRWASSCEGPWENCLKDIFLLFFSPHQTPSISFQPSRERSRLFTITSRVKITLLSMTCMSCCLFSSSQKTGFSNSSFPHTVILFFCFSNNSANCHKVFRFWVDLYNSNLAFIFVFRGWTQIRLKMSPCTCKTTLMWGIYKWINQT